MSLYVATYDIANDGRRRAVARELARHGLRVQESVFEVWLEPDELRDLRIRLGAILSRVDAFDFYPVDLHGSRPRVRWSRPPEDYDPVIVIG